VVFNSFNFVIFLIPVLVLYWSFFKKSSVLQNSLLLASSVIFYGLADLRFLFLLVASILINYGLGLKINKSAANEKTQKRYWYLGLIFNIGLLVYFKYTHFFIEGFVELLHTLGVGASYNSLTILLPLGISFFTFQSLGYLIDVYNEEVKPSSNLLEFSLFISYFPKILSGPIERASNLLPQIKNKRTFSYEVFVDGLRQILWGLFAKVVIAENCAIMADPIFNDYENKSGLLLLIGAFYYAIQLYADFSGYSNMAIGISKLFGIQLMRNFSTPFFSTNISDFWRKWHISLTTWMMDYVFTPLSFTVRNYHKKGLVIAIITTFVLVGFWHGAHWTFGLYGLLHGLYFIPLVYSGVINSSQKLTEGTRLPSLKVLLKMVALFVLIMLTDVFFRVPTVLDGIHYFRGMGSKSLFDFQSVFVSNTSILILVLVVIFMGVEWLNKEKTHDFDIKNLHLLLRWLCYIGLFVMLILFGRSSETFIYFQF